MNPTPLPNTPASSLGPEPQFCRYCGRVLDDERDRVFVTVKHEFREEPEGFYRCIADGKCHDRATVQMVGKIAEGIEVKNGKA